MKHSFLALTTVALLTAIFSGKAGASPTLDITKARGFISCGVNGNRAGFSALDDQGQWVGMDVDICKAIAAAVFADKNKVRFVKTTTQNRFTALQTGEADVLARNVTWTLGRDAKLGIDFVAPTFYDGQGFMVNKNSGAKTINDLNGATVCVLPGSTSQKVVEDVFRANGMDYRPIIIENKNEINTAFFGGRCDVYVQSISGLISARASVAPNPDDFLILPGIYGKDPMAPAVRQGDAQWRDIVDWTIYAMISAEEMGVMSANVDTMKHSNNPEIARLLGTKSALGVALGLENDWAYQIIKQVGNYAEVFDRNVGEKSPMKLKRGLNALWSKGGLLYAPPFK